jgi:spermidine/putrescine transport system permease protein
MRRARLSTTVAAWVAVAAILVFLFLPVVLVVLFSFNSGTSTSPPLEGLSVRWYEALFEDQVFREALSNSVVAALVVVLCVLVGGTLAALAAARSMSRLIGAYTSLVIVPLVVPGLFLGVALLSFVNAVGVQPSLAIVCVGHALVTLPIVFLVVSARLRRLDLSVVEAARDLGANSVQAFVKVILPQLAPTLVGASLLVVALSLDEFLITSFVNGGDVTLPVLILSRLRQGLDPSVNAIASLILGCTILAAALAGRFISTKDLFR